MTALQPQARTTWPLCSKCRNGPAADGQRWCRGCSTRYMRDYRRKGVPRKFQWFVRERAAEFGITLPADFFDVAKLGVQGRR